MRPIVIGRLIDGRRVNQQLVPTNDTAASRQVKAC